MTTLDTRGSSRTFLDALLDEQRQMTPVERFARLHSGALPPAQARFYRDLIPLTRPGPGEQYAFAVDLDSCSGCKSCVSACHSLNGLDEAETWRSTGLLHGGDREEPYYQTVTTACHHCVDPACLNGCPVLAYEKDSATGIVRHLDDQCIGCQYCVLKCPYDVPKYSRARGIVRKCDLCHSRLAADEAPACVQACPSEAISIRIVSQAEVRAAADAPGACLLPGAVSSAYTQPATRFASARTMPANTRPADAHALRREHAHWPLIVMLLLTQVAAGLFVIESVSAPAAGNRGATLGAAGLSLLLLGLAASVFHLGRPLGAWRAFLGWRRSWMSREIIAFGLFAAVAAADVLGRFFLPAGLGQPFLGIGAAAAGILAVACSAMIYVDTRRPAWNAWAVVTEFLGSVGLLGTSVAACLLAWAAPGSESRWLIAAALIRSGLFLARTVSLHAAIRNPASRLHGSARIITGLLRPLAWTQPALFLGATAFGLAGLAGPGMTAAVCASISLALTIAAQVSERYCFFVACPAPRMPGGIHV